MENFALEKEDLARLFQSGVIAVIALGLYNGLKGRILQFANWAELPRLAFTPVRLTLRYLILTIATLLVLDRWGLHLDTLIAVVGTELVLVAIGFVAIWSLRRYRRAFAPAVLKPFSVGDEVGLLRRDSVTCKAVDLSLLFTTLEAGNNETVLIHNSTLFQRIFKRLTGKMTGGLDYQLRRGKAMS